MPKTTIMSSFVRFYYKKSSICKTEGKVTTLVGLVKDGLLSIKDAALRANMTESAFEAEIRKMS